MMSEVIFNEDNIAKIDDKKIQDLKKKALKMPSRKIRLCLHKNIKEPLHEMIIVHCKGAYIRPHKHIRKSESFHIIEGSFFLVVFDESGKVIEKALMNEAQENGNFICRLDRNLWHMLIPITDFIVFHETTEGPYTDVDNSIFAPWAPKDDDVVGIEKFIKRILKSK